jgi:hypothetical protein
LDFFIPSQRLGFELHGEQHYNNLPFFTNPKERDKNKSNLCTTIDLIVIPYWWNLKKESVAGEIHMKREELFNDGKLKLECIPEKPTVITQPKGLRKARNATV